MCARLMTQFHRQTLGSDRQIYFHESIATCFLRFPLQAGVNKDTVVLWHIVLNHPADPRGAADIHSIAILMAYFLSVQHRALDPRPGGTGLSHDVRWPGCLPPAVLPGSHQTFPLSQTPSALSLSRCGRKLPENHSNMIILAPLVLEDVLSQSGKSAKLIHFVRFTWQLRSGRTGREGEQGARKRTGWTIKSLLLGVRGTRDINCLLLFALRS